MSEDVQNGELYRELMLGCGSRRQKMLYAQGRQDWSCLTSVDIDPSHNPDIVLNLNYRPLPFEDNTFNEIHAYEVLEHLGNQGDFYQFFKEFTEYYRILKPGGLLFATVPSWKSMWAWGDPGHVRVICTGTLVFLDQTEYTKQVGVTPMADYRSIYKSDFERVLANDDGESFQFILRAIKPSRYKA